MTYPRNKIINLKQTQYYHCVSRCVRRAYLCGKDRLTGRNYEHRRGWVEKRLLLLANVFTVDVYAYAVMHNHTHLVLYVNQAQNSVLNDEEILKRWSRIAKLDPICKDYLNATLRDQMSENESDYAVNRARIIRSRLGSISWFMRFLNQHIARRANKEDDCTGRFWEGRFKSQALLTQEAILACMSYVDLNPVRAGICQVPETAEHTSVFRRISHSNTSNNKTYLLPLNRSTVSSCDIFLHQILLSDYRKHLSVIIESNIPSPKRSIKIGSLHVNKSWLVHANQFEKSFTYAAGSKTKVDLYRKSVLTSLMLNREKRLN